MRRRFIVWALVAMSFSVSAASSSVAQDHPASLVHFRVVPGLSTVHQAGGFAGVNWHWRLTGEYDLARGPNSATQVAFRNAEIWGSIISKDPAPAIALDIDETFNLEGLNGRVLPTMGPFPVFEFRGTTEDDSKVHLLGTKIGPWMYLRGGVFPPDGGSDYFTYHMRSVARSRPFADLNDDGAVDAADYVLLRKLSNLTGPDGVTAADWKQQFGERAPDLGVLDGILNAAMGSVGPAANVPEPAVTALVWAVSLAIVGWRRR